MSGSASADLAIGRVLEQWEAVAFRWQLERTERASLLGLDGDGAATDIGSYCSPTTECRLRLLVALDATLSTFFGDDARTCAWLRRENAGLGGRVPLDVMARSPEWIRWLVATMATAA